VLFPGKEGRYPVAFEAQFSRITFGGHGAGRSIQERTRDYHANGVHVVWCFFEHHQWSPDLIDTCRRAYGCVGIFSSNGLLVRFEGVKALWLDTHPIDALDKRTAWRQKQEAERQAERERQQREEEERRAEAARREAEQRARMEARHREEDAERWRRWQEEQREFAARRRAEYERQAEDRRRAEREIIERARAERAARTAHVNRDLGIDPARDLFTVEPVDVPASAVLGLPRRTLYRVLFHGEPVGWSEPSKAAADLARLNAIRLGRKRGAA
jgi:hypothetical protein